MYTDYAHEARSARSTAAAATRRAEADARQADTAYEAAALARSRAARYASLRIWNTAHFAAQADSWTLTGDVYLRASFHNTEQAAFYRELGARYAELAARQARVPDFAGEPVTR